MSRGRLGGSGASQEPGVEQSPSPSVDNVEDGEVPPFFNTTFSTHRVSPLYIGPDPLTANRLETIARRLRDVLVGDVVRGIQIGLESTETSVGQVGPLRTVQIRWFQASTVLGGEVLSGRPQSRDLGSDAAQSDWEQLSLRQKHGLWIDIRHENAAYVALLLPGLSPESQGAGAKASGWTMQPGEKAKTGDGADKSHFLHLPLLLLRMPLPLKNVIGDWLSSTFDCRVSKMSLGTKTIINVWENWIKTAGFPDRGPDFAITFAFNVPLPQPKASAALDSEGDPMDEDPMESGLRSMEVTISPQDLRRFAHAGMSLQPENSSKATPWQNDPGERRRLAGTNSDDGWAWRSDKDVASRPFTEALGRYLDHHLALNMFHPSVRVTQISCAGFVLGQSRVKVVRLGEMGNDLSRAAWMFVMQLGERTKGGDVPQVFSS